MIFTTRSLLKIDKLFYPLQRMLEFVFNRMSLKQTSESNQVIAIKLMGKGSIIRFILACEEMGAEKNSLSLITFEQHRGVCEWLVIPNVFYVRTDGVLHFLNDCFTILFKSSFSAKAVVNLERCSSAVASFGLLLSMSTRSKFISFEAERNYSHQNLKIYSANDLTLQEIFEKCVSELPSSTEKRKAQKSEVSKNKIIVNINTSDLLFARRYSIDGYAQIIRQLYHYNTELQFILTGSPNERAYVEILVSKLKDIPVQNMAGNLSFDELAGQVAKASGVITGDSMPLHLAAYIGVPVIALWGPTQPAHFGYNNRQNIHSATMNLSCSPCFVNPSSKPAVKCNGRIDCLSQLEPGHLVTICKTILESTPEECEINFPKLITSARPALQLD